MDIISYNKAKKAEELAKQIADGEIETGVLRTKIDEKLNDLETQYAPELNDVKSQLAQKVSQDEVSDSLSLKRDKSVPISLNDAGSDLLTAIQGGTTVEVLSIPRPKSVTPEKTTFIKQSSNLFNKETVTQGSYVDASGNIATATTYSITDFIEVKPSTDYSLYGFLSIGRYDENQNFISRVDVPATGGTMTTPENCYYLRVNYQHTASYSTRRINEGLELLPYEDYYNEFKGIGFNGEELKEKSIGTEKLKDKSITLDKTDFIKTSTNLFDISKVTKGYYVDASGNMTASSTYSISDFIKVEPSDKYTLYGFITAGYYDENKNFILRANIKVDGETKTIPTTTHYIRLNYQHDAKYARRMNSGSELLPYEDFYYQLDGVSLSKEGIDRVIENIDLADLVTTNDRFMFDLPVDGVFDTNEIYGDFPNWHGIKASEVYTLWDDLMNQYPSYITKELLGNDALGNPISVYYFTPEQPSASVVTKIPKIFLTLGVHGFEHASTLSSYLMFKQMCEKWQDYPLLEALRFNVKFIVIPVVNPSGWDAFTRKNHNGVDLNRNFPYNWVQGDPTSSTYGGTAPLSELESQYVMTVFNNNPDIDIMYDFHNFHEGSNGNYFIWLSINSGIYQQHMAQNLISRMTRKWKKEYAFIPNDFFIGYTDGYPSEGTGTISNYARSLGIKFSATFEICNKWVLDAEGAHYDEKVATCGVEALTNWLLINLREFNR